MHPFAIAAIVWIPSPAHENSVPVFTVVLVIAIAILIALCMSKRKPASS